MTAIAVAEAPSILSTTPFDDVFHRMFEVIDTRQFSRLPEFFHPRVVYERPGYDAIDGLPALIHFYEKVRIIVEGRHTIHSVFQSGIDGAAVSGSFKGVSVQGDALSEPFCDVYFFENDRIVRRKTFFFRKAI
ncbi:nuclear transport factor 2 family protein [Burkholderia alba]|uniref:nuclear transport factor 2 family protein n=1 Tax=Burkholderia alba TaxID=2683677 RepID=UPI002B05C36B|nr:nuclear transport factor 2 family protein [Burkholderia alba]